MQRDSQTEALLWEVLLLRFMPASGEAEGIARSAPAVPPHSAMHRDDTFFGEDVVFIYREMNHSSQYPLRWRYDTLHSGRGLIN